MTIEFPASSHPLKWDYLSYLVKESGLENPDIWIEDQTGLYTYNRELVCESEEVYAVDASICVMFDRNNNRIIIRHHY